MSSEIKNICMEIQHSDLEIFVFQMPDIHSESQYSGRFYGHVLVVLVLGWLAS